MAPSPPVYLEFSPQGVLEAYRHGIFPMADELTGCINWYLPESRTVVPLYDLHVSRRLARVIRSGRFEIRADTEFTKVMRNCADRAGGSWISDEFIAVYTDLHRQGWAHSVETWREGRLVGGLYGLAIGAAFMGESMFHKETDASKVAFVALVDRLRAHKFMLLDAQLPSEHLSSLGAIQIPALHYDMRLQRALRVKRSF